MQRACYLLRKIHLTGLLHRYMDLVLRQATEDPVVTGAYLAVISMFAPPQSLVRPRMLLRVLRP